MNKDDPTGILAAIKRFDEKRGEMLLPKYDRVGLNPPRVWWNGEQIKDAEHLAQLMRETYPSTPSTTGPASESPQP